MTESQNKRGPIIGVSSWALHQELGAPPLWNVEAGAHSPRWTRPTSAMPLLELPALLARHGFETMQICHFHLPTRAPAYLDELRVKIENSGVTLHALLVDDGDLTHPQHGARDRDWIASWLPVAARLGARNVRVIAGKTRGPGDIARSADAMLGLSALADEDGLGVLTENWFDVLATPDAVLQLLQGCENRVDLLLDFSNWNDLSALAAIAPRASSCHAQARFSSPARVDETHFRDFMKLPFAADFRGPFVLVNGGREGMGPLRDAVRAHFQSG